MIYCTIVVISDDDPGVWSRGGLTTGRLGYLMAKEHPVEALRQSQEASLHVLVQFWPTEGRKAPVYRGICHPLLTLLILILDLCLRGLCLLTSSLRAFNG